MSNASVRIFFLTGAVLVSAAAVVTPYAATSITVHVAGTSFLERWRTVPILPEPQVSNRAIKGDRDALLHDSPSYTNFDSFPLQLALSKLPARESANGLLNEAQIVAIEKRLQLNLQQSRYWPPVGAALRDVSRRYFQNRNRARTIPLNSNEVKQLIEAAVPLIAQLNRDQKREARQLMRIIGLERVAGEI